MKKNLLHLLLAAAVLLGIPTLASAHDHGGAHIELKIMQDGDLIEVSAEDLEVGESRQFISDSGKEVVLTRLEEGFSLTVDGEEIDLGHGIYAHSSGDHHGKKKIKKIIREEIHGGEDTQMMFITKGDHDGEEHEVIVHQGAHGMGHHGAKVIQIHRKSPIDQLQEDGVLDQLSDSDRALVVESLKKLEGEQQMKVHVMGGDHMGGDHKVWIDEDGTVHEVDIDVEIEEEN